MDNLIWNAYWSDGMLNEQVTISDFGGLEEFLFVSRDTGGECGCCMSWDGPEEGRVEFVEGKAEDKEEKLGEAIIVEREQGVEGEGEENDETDMDQYMKEVHERFEAIRNLDPDWKTPEFRFVQLKRDGKLV